jgi:AAA family ATP:ADP antiporter
LINIVTAIFAACLALFYALLQFDVPIGQVFFVWIGVLNMMIVAQFWGFANDLYTKDEGERLFAIVGFGASLGAVLGAVVAGWLIAPLGLAQLLLVGAGLLVAQAALTNYVDTRETARAETQSVEVGTTPDAEEKQPASVGAFGMVFGTPYLLLLGFMLLCLNLVNTTGEYILGSVIEDVARESVAAGTSIGPCQRV